MVDINKLTDKEKMELVKKGICGVCGKGTETRRETKNGQTIQYFSCGHKHITVEISEQIRVADNVAVNISNKLTEIERSVSPNVIPDIVAMRNQLGELRRMLSSIDLTMREERSIKSRFLTNIISGIIGFVVGWVFNMVLRSAGIPT